MKIVTKQSYNWMECERKNVTYQLPFEKCVKCSCGKSAILTMLIDDDEGLIAGARPRQLPNDYPWPHDCLAIAIYICECGEMSVRWNQG